MTGLPSVLTVWAGLLLAIALIDVAAYLTAAGRAQGAADAAALAALAEEDVTRPGRPAAARVAGLNGARLEDCACAPGQERASVRASVPVDGLFIPRVVGRQRVTATADAQLAPAPAGPEDGGWGAGG